MTEQHKNLYIAWVPFQRRAESLAAQFDLEVCYHHHSWSERNKFMRLASWFVKCASTFRDLIKYKPSYIFIQLAPTPLLYVSAIYCSFTRCQYISDCHNTMLYDAHNIHWPFAKSLLRRSLAVLVHNDDVKKHADRHMIDSIILRDPLPSMSIDENIKSVANIDIHNKTYVIVPGSLAEDEPLNELFDAASQVPDTDIILTWFSERLPPALREKAPANIHFTGFLEENDFNALYRHASAAIVLTTREGTQPSGASEAISLGIPLIVSRIKTTTRLYKDHPIYVDNTADAIAQGIKEALSDYSMWSNKIAELRSEINHDADQQIKTLKDQFLSPSREPVRE